MRPQIVTGGSTRFSPPQPAILLHRLAACATALDRAADVELARGRIAVAERLSRRADELREGAR